MLGKGGTDFRDVVIAQIKNIVAKRGKGLLQSFNMRIAEIQSFSFEIRGENVNAKIKIEYA